MVTSAISLHLSLYRQHFAVPLYKGVNDFAFVVGTRVEKIYKPTIFNTLTTVGVWNGNIGYLAAPIPISPKFRCPSIIMAVKSRKMLSSPP